MQTFSSVKEGLAAMKLLTEQQRKVGALLTFQDASKKVSDVCFLFESIEAPAVQVLNQYKDLKIARESQADMPALLSARDTAIRSAIAVLGDDELDIEPHGHAEEFLLREFDACAAKVKDISMVTVYVSHSPCTALDRAPSDAMKGWPKSRTAKFKQLAATHPKYHFTICFWKAFGAMEGNDDAAGALKKISGDLKNLAFAKV